MNDAGIAAWNELEDNPQMTAALASLQRRVQDSLTELSNELARALAAQEAASQTHTPTGNVCLMTRQSQQRQNRASRCRKDAEHLIAASLHNLENAEWDPARPDTYRLAGDGLLQRVLQWRPGS